ELGGEDRIFGGPASRGIRQDVDSQAVQQPEDALASRSAARSSSGASVVACPEAAHCHGGQLGAAGHQRLLEQRLAGRPAGTHDQVRVELLACDFKHLCLLLVSISAVVPEIGGRGASWLAQPSKRETLALATLHCDEDVDLVAV